MSLLPDGRQLGWVKLGFGLPRCHPLFTFTIDFLKELSTLFLLRLLLSSQFSSGFCPIAPLKMVLKRSVITSMPLNHVTFKHSHPAWPQECSGQLAVFPFLKQSLWHPWPSWLSFCLFPLLFSLPLSAFLLIPVLQCWVFSRLDPELVSLLLVHFFTGWSHSFWGFSFTPDRDSTQVFCLHSPLELQPRYQTTYLASLTGVLQVPQSLCWKLNFWMSATKPVFILMNSLMKCI